MRCISDNAPTPILELNPDIPQWLSETIERLMAKEKPDRFASAEEVHELLEGCLNHVQQPTVVELPEQLNKSSSSEQPVHRRRRQLWNIGGWALIALLFAGVVYYIQTDKGTVRVEVLDESLAVTIENQTVTMQEGSRQPLTFRPGLHKLVVTQGETELITDNFEVHRNGDLKFRVTMQKGKVILFERGKELQSKLISDASRNVLPEDMKGRVPAGEMAASDEMAASSNTESSSPVVELRWAASEYIPGFTHHENRGDYTGNTYYSLKPVLTLTPEFVASVKHNHGTFPPSGGRIFHWVTVTLNKNALAILEREITKVNSDPNKAKKVEYVTLLIDGEEGFSATLLLGWKDGVFMGPNWTTGKKAERIVEKLRATPAKLGEQREIHAETARVFQGRQILRDVFQKRKTVPTNGKTEFEGVQAYHARVQLNANAKTALVLSGAVLQMWNLETGRMSSLSEWGGAGGVVGFVPNQDLTYHAKQGIEFWDSKKGTKVDFVIPHLPGPAESNVIPPAISKDGRLLAARVGHDKFRLWNLATRKPSSAEIDARGSLTALTFSPNGKWLFCKNELGWNVWDTSDQSQVGGPYPNQSSVQSGIAISPDSRKIATINNEVRTRPAKYEVVIHSVAVDAWEELKRFSLPNPLDQVIWIDDKHLAIVEKSRIETYRLSILSMEAPGRQEYGYLRTFDRITVAPDRKHFVITNYVAATCWQLGRKEHLWKLGTSEAGRSHDVHFGKDWVLLYEKGQTTSARPAIVRLLKSGNEIFRRDDVIATSANGPHIGLLDGKGIEIWQANHSK